MRFKLHNIISNSMKKIKIGNFVILLFIVFNISKAATINHWETVVYNYDTLRYFIGNTAPDANWRATNFNDKNWTKAIGGVGFNTKNTETDTLINTEINDSTLSLYIRIKFNIADTSKIENLALNIDYDDAFVAYLNNVEIARAGIEGVNPLFNELGQDHEAKMYTGGLPDRYIVDKAKIKNCLVNNLNILTIQVHNASITSSDLTATAFLMAGLTDSGKTYRNNPSWFIAPPPIPEIESAFKSNLPIVLIDTKSQNIPDGNKINAIMKIIRNGNGIINNITDVANDYYGNIGIEIRGSFSASFPQKNYNIETRNSDSTNRNCKIMGMPTENDWVLVGHYNDKVMMRNELSYYLFREMGNYASRTRYCEVFINNQYQGIYFMGEKVKRDNKRVDIAELLPTHNAGDSLTGGYMFKNDNGNDGGWYSNFSEKGVKGVQEVQFLFVEPEFNEATTQQKNYIKAFVDSFETALYGNNYTHPVNGYYKYINMTSFIDYFLLSELSRNVDAYKKSRFFYKDRNSEGWRLNSGPAWDFDWAYKNMPYYPSFYNTDGSGWMYDAITNPNAEGHSPKHVGWAIRFMTDTVYVNAQKTRYVKLRKTVLSNENINAFIDSIANLLKDAQVRHFAKWDLLGKPTNGAPEVDGHPQTYTETVTKFKKWIDTRLKWLDANMPGKIDTTNNNKPPVVIVIPPINNIGMVNANSAICRIYPNPANNIVHIEGNNYIERINFYTISGKLLKSSIFAANQYMVTENISTLSKGIIFVSVTYNNGIVKYNKLIIE